MKANPGAKPLTGRSSLTHGSKAAPNKNQSIPNPAGGKHSPKAVKSQQLGQSAAKAAPLSDYASDGATYGKGGSKVLGYAPTGKMAGQKR